MNFCSVLLRGSFICIELEVMKVWWSIEDWCHRTPRPLPSAFNPLSFIYNHSASSFLPSCFQLFCFVSLPLPLSFSPHFVSLPPLQDSSSNCLCLRISVSPFSPISNSISSWICFLNQKWLLCLNKDNSAITQTSVTHSELSWSGIVTDWVTINSVTKWLYFCVVVWVSMV